MFIMVRGMVSLKLKEVPPSRQPRFDSVDKIVSSLKTIILQDIAINEGLAAGGEDIFTFRHKKGEVVSGLLYDAYLKRLVGSAKKPDTLDVYGYYDTADIPISLKTDIHAMIQSLKADDGPTSFDFSIILYQFFKITFILFSPFNPSIF